MYSSKLLSKLKEIKFESCELDSNKVKLYLDQINPSYEIKPLVKQILSQTVRIPTIQVCEQLKQMVQEYLLNPSNPIPNYVHMPNKIGSEQYFFSQIYELFPHINLSTNIIIGDYLPKEIPHEINLLIVDDASFSGNNTIGKIDYLSYANKKTKINYIVAIPYQLEPIDQVLKNTKLPSDQMKRISLINIPGHAQPPYIRMDSYKLGNESDILSTCFFDHKVPNEFGSFPQIYLEGKSWLKNTPNFGNLFVGSKLPTKQPILDLFDLV